MPKITWLGHSTFRMISPGGSVVLVDPWVEGNPACPAALKKFDRLDVMLITHGHFDHISDAVALARQHQPQVVGVYEVCAWLESKGASKTLPMNKGGSQQVGELRVTMVHVDHSCGILDGDKIVYGGEAVGYVIEGTVKFSGSVADLADETRHAELPWISIPTRHYQPRRLAVSPLRCELSRCRRSPGPTRHYGVLRSDPAVVPHVRFSIRSPAQASTGPAGRHLAPGRGLRHHPGTAALSLAGRRSRW